MILRFLHWLASRPLAYDWIQVASGSRYVHPRLAEQIGRISPARLLLDLGGGTGTLIRCRPEESKYICLDLEFPKLAGFRKKVPEGLALQGDATAMPVATGLIDAVICTAVAHHLDEAALGRALAECHRVLRTPGSYIFMDAVKRPDRLLSRLLWSADRGAHPYTEAHLREILGRQFDIVHWERFTVFHEYVLAVLRKRS